MENRWYASTLPPDRRPPLAGTFRRFLGTPEAMHLMRTPGMGVPPSRFRPPGLRHHLELTALAGWQWWAADPPGTLRPWAPGELLPPTVHDIWCRPGPRAPWRVQLMLDESRGEHWTSRRDPRVHTPIRTLGLSTPEGIPYLAPEIQLYYKAQTPRPKDEEDFATALPILTPPQRQWLIDAITATHGPHRWTEFLRTSTSSDH